MCAKGAIQNQGKRVVILVDNKRRDLLVAALIGHHLEQLGLECHLEPLEAYRGVLAAYRPHLILSNHLTAPHLVAWSQRLAELGVLCAVLPNEGICYDEAELEYNAGKFHNGAHIDLFFCWNEPHQRALRKCGFGGVRGSVLSFTATNGHPGWASTSHD